MMITDELIRAALAPFGFEPSAGMVDGIRRYVHLLQMWNRRIPLTSLKDTRSILERHFGESLFAVHAVPIEKGRLADVGSGGGFPGLPIKMAVPGAEVLLIESNKRKAAFLSEVIRTLGLTGASVADSRMEESSTESPLDFVVARALGNISTLLGWSRSVLRPGGQIVLWLGAKDGNEVSLAPGWAWQPPILLPRSENRVLLVGAINSSVSR